MSQRKGELAIGQRIVAELYRLYPQKTDKFIAQKVGVDRKSITDWKNGITPHVIYLQSLALLGGDVHYVLTDCRKE